MALKQQKMTPAGTKPVTADELLAMHSRGVRGELIRGVFCPKMSANQQHAQIAAKLAYLLGTVVYPNRMGKIMTSDLGVRLSANPDTVREPDVAYISAEREPPDAVVTGYSLVMPNLVAEIVSPNDSPQAVYDKASMWLLNDVQAVWVIWPDTQTIEVHRPGETLLTLSASDTLSGGDALPGFSVPVREIFES